MISNVRYLGIEGGTGKYHVLQLAEGYGVDDRLVNAPSPAALGLDCQLEYVYSIGRKPNKS